MAARPEGKREERRCIVSGDVGEKDGLIRFVVDPEGRVMPDLAERLPGRGMWVSADRATMEQAIAKGLFARAAKAKVIVEPTLADDVERILARRAAETLGLAKKAGALVTGFEKVLTAISSGKAALLIEARDGAEDGRRKIQQRLRVIAEAGGPANVPTLRPLWSDEMGLALGRANVVHAALTQGRMKEKVVGDLARLDSYGRQERPSQPIKAGHEEDEGQA
ncbi:MAG: RNA-binding protein [Rhizobiales bacterium]|nr:RNA-binding protein [Hyphomicrobiales bacterium]